MTTAYLGLGSNLGDREANLRKALEHLEAAGVEIVHRSHIYETEPQEVFDQPWFLNLVVEVATHFSAVELLARVQAIEGELGRKRAVPKGPRVIDIDILFYGDSVLDTAELQIPHLRLAERRFVLEPLSELAPMLRHPVTGRSVAEMLSAIEDQVVKRH